MGISLNHSIQINPFDIIYSIFSGGKEDSKDKAF